MLLGVILNVFITYLLKIRVLINKTKKL